MYLIYRLFLILETTRRKFYLFIALIWSDLLFLLFFSLFFSQVFFFFFWRCRHVNVKNNAEQLMTRMEIFGSFENLDLKKKLNDIINGIEQMTNVYWFDGESKEGKKKKKKNNTKTKTKMDGFEKGKRKEKRKGAGILKLICSFCFSRLTWLDSVQYSSINVRTCTIHTFTCSYTNSKSIDREC